MTTDQLLDFYGFRLSGKCSCDGIATLKYKSGQFQVNWRKGKYTFKLKQNGMTSVAWTSVSQLNEVLEKYIQKEAAEVVPG